MMNNEAFAERAKVLVDANFSLQQWCPKVLQLNISNISRPFLKIFSKQSTETSDGSWYMYDYCLTVSLTLLFHGQEGTVYLKENS